MIKPIIFSVDSVRAIVDGRKCQTRRVVRPQPEFAQMYEHKGKLLYEGEERVWCYKGHVSSGVCNEIDWMAQYAPYTPGDVLWVKEAWANSRDWCDADGYLYRAEWGENADSIRWNVPMFMPKTAARIFIRVTDARVERLQEISDADAVAEGYVGVGCTHPVWDYIDGCADCANTGYLEPPRLEFIEVWDALNAKRGYGWDTNPYVWCITFERCDKPEGWPDRR